MEETVKRNVRIPVNVTEFDLKKTTLLEGCEISSIRVIGYVDTFGHKRMLRKSEFIHRPESEDTLTTVAPMEINECFMSHGKTFHVDTQISLIINWDSGFISISEDTNTTPHIKKLNIRVTGYKYQKDDKRADSQYPDIDTLGLAGYLEAITHNRYKSCIGYIKTQDVLNKLEKRQTVTLNEYNYMIDQLSSMAKEDMFMYPETVPHWDTALEYFDDHVLKQMRYRLYDYDQLCGRVNEVMEGQKTKSVTTSKDLK